MKKSSSLIVQENLQTKFSNASINSDLDKKIIYKRKNTKRDEYKKIMPTKGKTKESSKEEKKEIEIKTKTSKDNNKIKKPNLKEKEKEKEIDKNKTIENTGNLTQKKQKKKIRKIKFESISQKKKVKNSFSQKNIGKERIGYSTRNKILKNTNLTSNRKDSPNNILTSDNFIKNLLTNYIDGTDNILNEDLEPFNNIDNNDDYENFSFNEDNNIENNTMRETINYKNSMISKEDLKSESNTINTINNLNKNNDNKEISKNKRKLSKIIFNNKNTQIRPNYNSFINSPIRFGGRYSTKNSNKKFIYLNKKNNNNNILQKRKSLTKPKKKEKQTITYDNGESKMRRKILYSNKIINSLNKSKQNNANNDMDSKQKETMPIASNTLNLDIIFENNKISKNDAKAHHYLINTVSAKNKMVQKKMNIEQAKTNINSFGKIPPITVDNDSNMSLLKKYIFRLNKTPKVRKEFKVKDKYSINTNINNTRNDFRKYSFRVNREYNSENNISLLSTMNNTKTFNGKIDDYLITKELGKGSYAVVKLAMHKSTKNKYAIKIYSKQSLIDPQKRNTVKNEINILKQLDNDNIMKLYEVIDTSSNLYLVLEYINGINLLEIIKNEKYHYIKEDRAKKLFRQIVKGISYCHKKNIFHRDIKLENILVLKDDTIKIIDFGFGVKCNRDTYQKLFCGTPSYMAPEIVKKEKYIACYSDAWSLGVLFYSMLFGVFPFKGKDDDELFEKINEAKLSFPEYNKIGEKTKELFEKIFIVDPIKRISLDDMLIMLYE